MRVLDHLTTAGYLSEHAYLNANETAVVQELSGGVSNIVLRVQRGRGACFILKQAREKLRVTQDWSCDIARIFQEIDTLRVCHVLLKDAAQKPAEISIRLPEILWQDRENYAFAMTAAPENSLTWKQELMAGKIDPAIARACGNLLGQLHTNGWNNPLVQQSLSNTAYFEALRVSPYYRRTAEVHPDLQPEIELLISSLPKHACTLVHGDFSPKNLLIANHQLMLVDFEVGHFGDPAFDTGFFLSHLILKTIWSAELRSDYATLLPQFWQAYREIVQPILDTPTWMALEERTIANLAGCLLARVDGKSPVEYLNAHQQNEVRQLARLLFRSPPESVAEVYRIVE